MLDTIQQGQHRKLVDFFFQIKRRDCSRTAGIHEHQRVFGGETQANRKWSLPSSLACLLHRCLTAEGGTLLSAALVDAVQSDSRTGDLKKSTFQDFQRVTGYYFWDDITQQTNSRSINMKNPLYWAMLVGMTVLLMEQGKWWILSSSEHLLSLSPTLFGYD